MTMLTWLVRVGHSGFTPRFLYVVRVKPLNGPPPVQPGGAVQRPQDMNQRFPVTAAALLALVALAGCGSSKPGSAPSSAVPSAPVPASPAATSSPASAPGAQAAGSIKVQDVSFVSADHGWALGS